MDSNFKHIQLETGEEFYVICDVYAEDDLTQFMRTRDPAIIVDIGPTYYKEEIYNPALFLVPRWIENDASYYYNDEFSDVVETKSTFNFMINKSNIHRYVLIKLLEAMNFTTDFYTFSGVDNFYTDQLKILGKYYIHQLTNLPNDIAGELVNPIKTLPKFYTDENSIVTDTFVTSSNDNSPAYNHNNYHRYLKQNFESTAVALISESVVNDKQASDHCIHFSEKTLFSILGLNFPIWVGGYAQADNWKNLGFDVFDNVINHSYQYKNTLLERCYYALFDNRHILEDITLASNLRKQYMDRLLKNRDLLLNGHLNYVIKTEAEKLPRNIADYIQQTKTIWFDTFDSKS